MGRRNRDYDPYAAMKARYQKQRRICPLHPNGHRWVKTATDVARYYSCACGAVREYP